MKQKLSETESEISVLKQKLSQAESQVVASESEACGLTGLLSERDSSFSLLQEKLYHSESETSSLKVKLSETETEISLLRGTLAKKDDELTNLSTQLEKSMKSSKAESDGVGPVDPNTDQITSDSEEIRSLNLQLEVSSLFSLHHFGLFLFNFSNS